MSVEPEWVEVPFATDPAQQDAAELIRNGGHIDWNYWAARKKITADQAARLAHFIDPIAWPADEYAQGPIPTTLRIRVERCAGWLAERGASFDLPGLVALLGDNAPLAMREMLSGSERAAAPKSRTRTNILDAVISRAQAKAGDPFDTQQVWAELMRMAQQKDPPAPLCGVVDTEGVKYEDQKGVEFFTKDALRKRLKRASP
jgi:hypothetical protein